MSLLLTMIKFLVGRKYMYDERKRREQDVSRIIVCFSVKNLLKWI